MIFYEKINKVNCLDYDDIYVIENIKKLNFNESNIDVIHNLDNDDINNYEDFFQSFNLKIISI